MSKPRHVKSNWIAKTNTHFTLIALIALSACHVEAATISYKCRADGKLLDMKIDDVKNTLAWRGDIYKITEAEDCARFGWHAERDGGGFNFCTATQGYADFQENGKLIRCNQNR